VRLYRVIVNLPGGGVEVQERTKNADGTARLVRFQPPRTFGWYSDAVKALTNEGFRLDVGDRYYREETA
jgi:hypothetical protein